jgi:GNAT superfamily N-acetyltransferase
LSGIEIREFRRPDREQVARLVNAHAAAVIPGAAASVNAVLGQFERDPGEFIVDPWVAERQALVAGQAGCVAAAALLSRYRGDPDVGPAYRNAGEIRWLLFWPAAPAGSPFWQDGGAAAQQLMDACLEQFGRWRVARILASGDLPVHGVYGVPEQWPHIAGLYQANGFAAAPGALEVVHLADLAAFPAPGGPPLAGLRLRRSVGSNGTRLSAELGDVCAGFIEVDLLQTAARYPQQPGLADIGNLDVGQAYRRRGIGSWLLRHAAQWLRLGQATRLLHYAAADETAAIAFAERHGFTELTRTRRGWQRSPLR